MIDSTHPLPIKRQAELAGISRGSVYYLPRPVSTADRALVRMIDEWHLEPPSSTLQCAFRQHLLIGVTVHRQLAAFFRPSSLNACSGTF